MKHDQQAIDRFFEPWLFPNEFGIPDVKEEDIEVLDFIQSGGATWTRKAKWNGRMVALRSWYSYGREDERSFCYMELLRYLDLGGLQGKLVPELYFVCRPKETGILMLGLELFELATGKEIGFEYQMTSLRDKLKSLDWETSRPLRRNCVAWIKNRRLVVIDLRTFFPYFDRLPLKKRIHTLKPRMTIFGIPDVSVSELKKDHDRNLRPLTWNNGATGSVGPGFWRNRKVTIVTFVHKRRESFLKEMERYDKFLKHGDLNALIARPLFISTMQADSIILGLEYFNLWLLQPNESDYRHISEMNSVLAKYGLMIVSPFVGKMVGDNERRIVFYLGALHEIRPAIVTPDQVNARLVRKR